MSLLIGALTVSALSAGVYFYTKYNWVLKEHPQVFTPKFISEILNHKVREWSTERYGNGHFKVEDGVGKVMFWRGERAYVIRFPATRGPHEEYTIIDGEGSDVTIPLYTFLGPYNNFFGRDTTPKDLGFTKLTFTNENDESRTFEQDEIINL